MKVSMAISQGMGDFLHLLVICVHECGTHYFLMSSVKRKRKSKGKRIMENVLKHFEDMQSEAEKRYQEWEDERWKRECEIEERRRKEDKEHERIMLQMLMQAQGAQLHPTFPSYNPPQHQMYSFNIPSHQNSIHNPFSDEDEQ